MDENTLNRAFVLLLLTWENEVARHDVGEPLSSVRLDGIITVDLEDFAHDIIMGRFHRVREKLKMALSDGRDVV